MKVLVDMNLSPDWVACFKSAGWDSIHWSNIGDPRAADPMIMEWAMENGFVVFTHDLDFGTTLALTEAAGPSVIQIRTHDVTPAALGDLVLRGLKQFQTELERGALIVIDEAQMRARVLPLRNN